MNIFRSYIEFERKKEGNLRKEAAVPYVSLWIRKPTAESQNVRNGNTLRSGLALLLCVVMRKLGLKEVGCLKEVCQ